MTLRLHRGLRCFLWLGAVGSLHLSSKMLFTVNRGVAQSAHCVPSLGLTYTLVLPSCRRMEDFLTGEVVVGCLTLVLGTQLLLRGLLVEIHELAEWSLVREQLEAPKCCIPESSLLNHWGQLGWLSQLPLGLKRQGSPDIKEALTCGYLGTKLPVPPWRWPCHWGSVF